MKYFGGMACNLSGVADYTLEREEENIPVLVDWEYELSEAGDGSADIDFDCTAYDMDGKKIMLTENEEDSIYEMLKGDGCFNE